jgi:hypothetical protein
LNINHSFQSRSENFNLHHREESSGGLGRVQGVLVSPNTSRLKVGLDEHFKENAALYKRPKLHRIDIRPITHRPDHVTQYAGKALRSWQFTEDDMLILPESMRERAQQAPLTDAEARRIRDIQSRFNVSDDVARAMLGNRRLAG